jgi:hypothetical protein
MKSEGKSFKKLPVTCTTPALTRLTVISLNYQIYTRVYLRISIKRGQTHRSKLQGGQSHIKFRESQFPGGGGESTPAPLK